MTAPIPNIISIDKTKISDEAGMSRVTVKFSFDQFVEIWELRANGDGPGKGSLVERDTGARVGEATVGSSVICGTAAGTELTAYIDWNEGLVEGSNRVDIYGRNTSEEWTIPSSYN